jgi:hypothetical protein
MNVARETVEIVEEDEQEKLLEVDLLDNRVFINRKPGLRLESVRWKEDAELLVLLPEEKRTSIYARSFLPSKSCPAEPYLLCNAGGELAKRALYTIWQ